jgi:hypothetical protein
METSDFQDASEQAPATERDDRERPETLFGYSRTSDDQTVAEEGGVDVSTLN